MIDDFAQYSDNRDTSVNCFEILRRRNDSHSTPGGMVSESLRMGTHARPAVKGDHGCGGGRRSQEGQGSKAHRGGDVPVPESPSLSIEGEGVWRRFGRGRCRHFGMRAVTCARSLP